MKDKTIVIKYGSGTLAGATGVDSRKLSRYARSIAAVWKHHNVVLVCSSSVAAGKAFWSHSGNQSVAPDLKVLAMLGSGSAFTAWQQALLSHHILAGQLLVTHREVDDPTEGPSLLAALAANMHAGIVTIVNENDGLSDIELAKLSYGGDNDGLAAHIAIKLQADTLLLLTNVNGLKHGDHIVDIVDTDSVSRQEALECVDASVSALGRGGMQSKVEAALRVSEQGIQAYIANADMDLDKVLAGNAGTHFVAKQINE